MFKHLTKLAVLATIIFSTQTFATQLQLTGAIAGTCTLSNASGAGTMYVGTVLVAGDQLSSTNGAGTPATIDITSNAANAFTVTVAQGTHSIPTQTNTQVSSTPVLTGANAGATFSGGSAFPTRTATLTNSGANTLTLNGAITRINAALLPGNYTLNYDVTCNAI